jgi:hypothetical protein
MSFTRIVVYTQAIAIAFALAYACCTAHAAEVVKKSDLPALKGGKVAAADRSPIPTCFAGDRLKVASSDALVTDWVASHEKHACAQAPTLYICRAGKNLSVRCE